MSMRIEVSFRVTPKIVEDRHQPNTTHLLDLEVSTPRTISMTKNESHHLVKEEEQTTLQPHLKKTMTKTRNRILTGVVFLAVASSYHLDIHEDSNLRRYDGASGTHTEMTKKGTHGDLSEDYQNRITSESENDVVEANKANNLSNRMRRQLQTEGESFEHEATIDEDLEENTETALERHYSPPGERDVIGDSIFPFAESLIGDNNIFDRQSDAEGNNNTSSEVPTHLEKIPSHHQQGP